jgi:hypothetical protein
MDLERCIVIGSIEVDFTLCCTLPFDMFRLHLSFHQVPPWSEESCPLIPAISYSSWFPRYPPVTYP